MGNRGNDAGPESENVTSNNLVKNTGGLHDTMRLRVIDEASGEWDSSVDFEIDKKQRYEDSNMNELDVVSS